MTSDLGEIAAYLSGFDYKWDKSIERKHIRRAMFRKDLRAELAEIPRTTAFQEQWPELSQLVQALVHDFVDAMKPSKAQLERMEKWKKRASTPHFPKFTMP